MFVTAEVWTIARTEKGNAVLIRPVGGNLAVPIFIGALEAQNILLGMGEVDIPRPMSHDLMLNAIRTMGGEILQVEIHTLTEGTFFANVLISHDGQRTTLDARPSDALALAVRANCQVYIEESIIEEAGISTSSVKGAPPISSGEDQEDEFLKGLNQGIAGIVEDSEESLAEFVDAMEGAQIVHEDPKSRQELEKKLKFFVDQELYEDAARIRDEIKKLD